MTDGEICSHPGKALEDHLINSQSIAWDISQHFSIPLNEKESTAILLHDIAKAHPTFQARLKGKPVKFGHAEPSAALVLACVRNLIYTEAVRRHHSRLENVEVFKKFWGEWDYQDKTNRIIKRIPWWQGAEAISTKLSGNIKKWFDLFPDEDEWEELLEDVVDSYGLKTDNILEHDWLHLRLLYSLLVTADRFEAAVGGRLVYDSFWPDLTRVEDYASMLKDRPLAEWREKIRISVVKSSRAVLKKPGIYTLTLPTGTGKTLVGLQVAMETAQRLNASGIIYVLPFVSLVEQNTEVARQIFDIVREDHHLAARKSDSLENDEILNPQQRFLEFFRYWQEPVIVTTLAKLWEVVYSPRANDTMSLHRLSKAVVVLDEPQAIRTDCWEGFGKTLEMFSQILNTTFILMTATQPEIVQGIELTPEPVQFPGIRHELHWLKNTMTVEEAALFLEGKGVTKQDSLLVCNTRKSALLMWIEMKKRGLDPYFLSRWLIPRDRSVVMQHLKEKEKQREKRCLISTQVIEAGIDLDFDLVFRDLGPLDSIIQVAGRCNRNFRPYKGEVFIGELKDTKGRKYSSIYDNILLCQTRLLLEQKVDFNEADCPEMIRAYYHNVRQAINSSKLWSNIIGGCWGEYISLFNDYDKNEAMLVVDYDGDISKEMEILHKPISEENDKMEAINNRRLVVNKLSVQSIPVNIKYLEEWFYRSSSMIFDDEDKDISQDYPGIWVVRNRGIGRIYRSDIGFVPAEIVDIIEGEAND